MKFERRARWIGCPLLALFAFAPGPALPATDHDRTQASADVPAPGEDLRGRISLDGGEPRFDAEACWARRGEGLAERGVVDSATAGCAAEGFAAAAEAAPDDLDLALRSLEADWFAATWAFEGAERRRIHDRMVALVDRWSAELDQRAGILDPGDDFDAQAEGLAAEPRAGELHFWAAVAWGVWGQERGWLASARGGVVARLRRHAEMALRLEPEALDGGGYRLLGRIELTLPRVPFVSGWVDRDRGLELLREALAVSRRDTRNLLFLAEGLLEHRPGARPEALELLREAAAREPDPRDPVERDAVATARKLLARLETLRR